MQSKSQSNLLVQGPSSTDLLPHTQSLHCNYSLYNAGTGINPSSFPSIIPSRPGSSKPQLSHVNKISRPFSSRPLSSRPGSRMADQSRSPSTIDSSRSPSRMSQHTPAQFAKVIIIYSAIHLVLHFQVLDLLTNFVKSCFIIIIIFLHCSDLSLPSVHSLEESL